MLVQQALEKFLTSKHPIDYPGLLAQLPQLRPSSVEIKADVVTIGKRTDITDEQYQNLNELCKKLIPWRKGPFNLFGIEIDGEWRSERKWNRTSPAIPSLEGKEVLDLGCNNGYFMYRMALEHAPKKVVGWDPVAHCYTQFQMLNHFAQIQNLQMDLLGVQHLPEYPASFDVIFSMGVIYHHRHPLEQLQQLKDSLRPGGHLILETIGIPGENSMALFPPDRYAMMRNVWFVPTLACLINWCERAKFIDIEVIHDVPTELAEQRVTPWSNEKSLADFLDPDDRSLTVEGHPAPRRIAVLCRKKK